MGEKERPSDANHSKQADHIQDSMPPVSSIDAKIGKDERVSMTPRAEAEVFEREQHSSQTQHVTPEREASSVDLREFRGLKKQVRILTEERNELLEENSQLRVENQELREYVENRRKQARESAAKYRETNREEYNARQAKLMRDRYAKQKQKAKSSSD